MGLRVVSRGGLPYSIVIMQAHLQPRSHIVWDFLVCMICRCPSIYESRNLDLRVWVAGVDYIFLDASGRSFLVSKRDFLTISCQNMIVLKDRYGYRYQVRRRYICIYIYT